jgi:hypothetical protein
MVLTVKQIKNVQRQWGLAPVGDSASWCMRQGDDASPIDSDDSARRVRASIAAASCGTGIEIRAHCNTGAGTLNMTMSSAGFRLSCGPMDDKKAEYSDSHLVWRYWISDIQCLEIRRANDNHKACAWTRAQQTARGTATHVTAESASTAAVTSRVPARHGVTHGQRLLALHETRL